ncbi:TIGR02117 family protein [Agrobacterium sp. CNPSo 3708]|uniref:TIGR02117 family protein n=1 Tax=Agrobacterium sp. CNPSo 3708 TaxID=3028150 RepID=UPI0030826AAD
MKFLKYTFIVLALAVTSIALGVAVPRQPTLSDISSPADTQHRILVLSNPIHTDIAVPVDAELLARFAFLRDANLGIDHPGLRYIVFGWGGRAFYTQTPTWADLRPMPVFKSFTIDDSVMHVALAGEIPLFDPAVMPVDLSTQGYARLVAFITGSFSRSAGREVPLIGQSYGRDDAFFEAEGSFNVLVGCNIWTAAALRQAGLSTGWWTPLPWLLTASLRLHNDAGVFSETPLSSGR